MLLCTSLPTLFLRPHDHIFLHLIMTLFFKFMLLLSGDIIVSYLGHFISISSSCNLTELPGPMSTLFSITSSLSVPTTFSPMQAICPNMHMSYRVTVGSGQEHLVFIALDDHNDTCRGCSCKNLLFCSNCQRYTLTQNVKLRKSLCFPSSQVFWFFTETLHRCSADFDNCGKLPIRNIGFRSSTAVLANDHIRPGVVAPIRLLDSSNRSGQVSSSRIAPSARSCIRCCGILFSPSRLAFAKHPWHPGVRPYFWISTSFRMYIRRGQGTPPCPVHLILPEALLAEELLLATAFSAS